MLKINFESTPSKKIYTLLEIRYEKGLFYRAGLNPKTDGIFIVTKDNIFITDETGNMSKIENPSSWVSTLFNKYEGTLTFSN